MSRPIRFLMFSDARVGTDESGEVASPDAALGNGGWRRGLTALQGLEYSARVDPRRGSGTHPLNATVHPLPYYQGLAGLVRTSPRMVGTVLALANRAEVVVARLPGSIGLMACLSAKVLRRPLAVELVGDVEDVFAGTTAGRPQRLLARSLREVTHRALRWASAVRYVTQTSLQAKYPPHRRTSTVAFSSVNLEGWDRPARVAASPFPSVIAVGSQEQDYKGHDLLIDAAPALLARHPSLKIYLVGDGRLRADLRERAAALGVDHCVEFVGRVGDKAALVDLVDAAWVYAMPSRTEGMPRALIEAMSRGKACVGSALGGIAELLESDFVFPADDLPRMTALLDALLSDAARRDAAGARNLHEAEAFRPSVLAERSARWTAMVDELAPAATGGESVDVRR